MELPIFMREHFNGMYRTDVYFVSKMIAESFVYILFPFLSFTIPYFAVGLNPAADRYFTGAGILVLVANSAVSFGKLELLQVLIPRLICNRMVQVISSRVWLRRLKLLWPLQRPCPFRCCSSAGSSSRTDRCPTGSVGSVICRGSCTATKP